MSRMLGIVLLAGAVLLGGSVGVARSQVAVAADAVEEIVTTVARSFSANVSEDGGITALRASVTACAQRYGVSATRQVFETLGPEAGVALRDIGPAGEDAAFALMRENGLGAVRVLENAGSRELVAKYGVDAGKAIIAHPAAAEDVIAAEGRPAIAALNNIDNSNALRLAKMVNDGSLAKGGDPKGLLRVVGMYGDRAIKYIWRHKGALALAVMCAAFVRHPRRFLDGAAKLAGTVVNPVARTVDWTLIALVLIGVATLWFFGPRLLSRIQRKVAS
ncbi:MAG: hypothetical protein ACP5QA_15805 [Phycisphaerae bacterium]